MAHPGVLASAALSLGSMAAAAATGPDYTGIALVISAIAGLLSAVTAMVIALRRKPTDPETVALLRQLAENSKPKDPS